MPIKPVSFEEYMKWYENHKVVGKGQTVSGVEFETTTTTAKALVEEANRAAKPNDRTCIQIVENHFSNHIKVATKAKATKVSRFRVAL